MGFFKARYVRDYVAAAKIKSAVIWAVEIAAVLILGIVLAVGYGKITVMHEGSMDPTLNAGDVLLVNRMAYRFSTPKRGDIIVYKTGDDSKKASTHIKRIIGLPGETVTIRDGKVYINDSTEPLRDDFCPETPVGDFGPYEVPEGCYFMLGDNRNVSKDSRYWLNPYVEKDKIIGKAFLRYWPLNKISMIE